MHEDIINANGAAKHDKKKKLKKKHTQEDFFDDTRAHDIRQRSKSRKKEKDHSKKSKHSKDNHLRDLKKVDHHKEKQDRIPSRSREHSTERGRRNQSRDGRSFDDRDRRRDFRNEGVRDKKYDRNHNRNSVERWRGSGENRRHERREMDRLHRNSRHVDGRREKQERSSHKIHHQDDRLKDDSGRKHHSRKKDRKSKSSRRKKDGEKSSDDEHDAKQLLSLMLEDEDEKEQRLIEERRKKREAILAKHAQQATTESVDASSGKAEERGSECTPSTSEDETDAQGEIVMMEKDSKTGTPNDKERQAEGTQTEGEEKAAEPELTRKKSADTFDMFSTSPGHVAHKMKRATRVALMVEEGDHLQENWDDGEGYYKARIGEVLADRYLVQGDLGKGVFSTVVKAQCQKTQQVVAIKMIRNNDTMRKAALKEISLLEELTARDPDNRKHCVRLLQTTEYRKHTCLVFESLSMNLRETLRKFGRKVGINVKGVRVYGKQLFTALRHLASLKIVHADIKPDNILVSANHSIIKLCDFGSAFKENDPENDPTPYLVSRFYRAPEIILGLPYDRI